MGLNKFGCFITLIFIYAMLISQAYCARIRLLDGFFKLPGSDNVLTTEPGYDLVLTQQNFQVLPSTAGYKSPDPYNNVGKVLLRFPVKQGPEYRSLVLNLLPKGTLLPSGPSKRTNNFS